MDKERKPLVNIAQTQNTEEHLRLLAAQYQLYSEAKQLRQWRLTGSLGLAIVAPIALYFQPDWGASLAAFGAVWLLIGRLLLKRVEVQKVKQAATIQEEFDTELFNLPWNGMLVGNKVTPELITLAANRYKGDYNKLRNWYSDTGSVPYPLDVLICQRTNLVWDWQLRRRYAFALTFLTIVYVLFLIIFAITTKRLVIDFLLGLLFPALSAIVEGIETAREHFRIAQEKETSAATVLSLWEKGLKHFSSVSRNKCRDIQDCIYRFRCSGSLVPDWWYNRFRTEFEDEMHTTAKQLIARVEMKVAQHSTKTQI